MQPEILGGGGGSVSLHENLTTNEVDNPTVKGKRFNPSSLVTVFNLSFLKPWMIY
jgi:hypothetical protein